VVSNQDRIFLPKVKKVLAKMFCCMSHPTVYDFGGLHFLMIFGFFAQVTFLDAPVDRRALGAIEDCFDIWPMYMIVTISDSVRTPT
jgi:hypothetical protein